MRVPRAKADFGSGIFSGDLMAQAQILKGHFSDEEFWTLYFIIIPRKNRKVMTEIKVVEHLAPVHYAQVLTYFKLSGLLPGLLLNVNSKTLKDSIHSVVNTL